MSRDRSNVTALLDDAPSYSRQNAGGIFLVIKGPDRGEAVPAMLLHPLGKPRIVRGKLELGTIDRDVDAACEELRAKGADVAIGPLTRDPGTRLAFIRGPEGIMVELVQSR